MRLCIALFAAFVLSSCVTANPPAESGFLDNNSSLKQDPNDESLLWWERENFDWSAYDKIMVDPIVIYFHPDAEAREIRAEELARLASECRVAIVKELETDFKIVDVPDEGVLRVRSAITNVMPAKVGLNIITTLVVFLPLDMGGASMEVEFLDALSQVRVASGRDTKMGVPTDVRSGFTSLGHARKACRDWAEELHEALKTNA